MQYINGANLRFNVPKHSGLAKSFIDNLAHKTLQHILLDLMALRTTLTGDSSDKLLPRVEAILLKTYRILSVNHALMLRERKGVL
jgi:hypothetical protein